MTNKTAETLRETLFDTIDDLRNGKIDANDARTVANIAKTIIDAARVELDYHKLVADMDMSGVEYQPHMGLMVLAKPKDKGHASNTD